MTSVSLMDEAGHPKLVLWDNPRGMGLGGSGEGGLGWRGHVYTYGQSILMYVKNCHNIIIILQLK